ncbi:MAG: polysaccharide biosynthesis tyrosine autokinase [Planctomycetota bacterium]
MPENVRTPVELSEETPLRKYLLVVRRRIWLILFCLVGALTVAAVWTFKATPLYEASAAVLIEERQPRVTRWEEVDETPSAAREYFETQCQLIRSADVMRKALEDPDVAGLPELKAGSLRPTTWSARARRMVASILGVAPAPLPEPWEILRDLVYVEPMRGTMLARVKVRGPRPEHITAMANGVARAFAQSQLQRKVESSTDAFRFLQQQTEKQRQQLLAAENALQEFREGIQLVLVSTDESANPVMARLTRLSVEATEVGLRRVELASQYQVIRSILSGDRNSGGRQNEQLFSLPAVHSDTTISALRVQLTQREEEVDALAKIYLEDHPQLKLARANVEMVRSQLDRALKDLLESLLAQYDALEGREEKLKQEYEEQNRTALALSKESLAFQRLEQEAARQARLFDVLVERLRQVELTSGYDKTNVEVREPASVPKRPVSPRKARNVAVGALLGLVLGLMLAFALEHLDDTVRTPEEMERFLSLPVLGFVPRISRNGSAGDGKTHRGLISLTERKSSASEAFRSIRTGLYLSSPAQELRTLVVTSAVPGEGKTTSASNLAIVIAQSGKRVLVIDGDFRRPAVHEVFGIDNNMGLSNLLIGDVKLEDAARTIRHDGAVVENLSILASGPSPPNPPELLGSMEMKRFLEHARSLYDRVIIDSPPVLFGADTSILTAACDGVIFVTKAAANSRRVALRALSQIASAHGRLIGGILNVVRVGCVGYYYTGYYYDGYSRYYSDYTKAYYSRGRTKKTGA